MTQAIHQIRNAYNEKISLVINKDVVAGDIIVLNNQVLVADCQAYAGREVHCFFRGPIKFPKSTKEVIEFGDVCYFDESNGMVSKVASKNTKVGICIGTATKESSHVLINLSENK